MKLWDVHKLTLKKATCECCDGSEDLYLDPENHGDVICENCLKEIEHEEIEPNPTNEELLRERNVG